MTRTGPSTGFFSRILKVYLAVAVLTAYVVAQSGSQNQTSAGDPTAPAVVDQRTADPVPDPDSAAPVPWSARHE